MSAEANQFRSDPRIDAEHEGTATLLIPEDEFPEDIIRAAEAAVEATSGTYCICPECIKPVARAILAERARCAQIADDECTRVLGLQDGKHDDIDRNLRMVAVLLPALAAAIRNPTGE